MADSDHNSDKTPDTRTLSEKRAEAGRKGGKNGAGKEKTMTEAAVTQRQEASQHSTGPVTDEGKAASSRNSYIHGGYSAKSRAEQWGDMGLLTKPCKSTCPKFKECSLVADELTKPGGDCLDKQVYVEAFSSIMDTLANNDGEYAHGMLAKIGAEAIAVLHDMREHLAIKSPIIMQPIIARDGKPIINPETQKPYETPILNPILGPYITLLDKLGVNLPELMATPRAIAKDANEKELGDALGDMLSGLGDTFGRRKIPGRTIDVTPESAE